MTNREKYMQTLQSKTDEEFAGFLSEAFKSCENCPADDFCKSCLTKYCDDVFLNWLRMEASE